MPGRSFFAEVRLSFERDCGGGLNCRNGIPIGDPLTDCAENARFVFGRRLWRLVEKGAAKLEARGSNGVASFPGRGEKGRRGGQPAADRLCFCGFRGRDSFNGTPGPERRGGAGTMSDTGEWDSGKSAAAGSIRVRATSTGDMGADCRDL